MYGNSQIVSHYLACCFVLPKLIQHQNQTIDTTYNRPWWMRVKNRLELHCTDLHRDRFIGDTGPLFVNNSSQTEFSLSWRVLCFGLETYRRLFTRLIGLFMLPRQETFSLPNYRVLLFVDFLCRAAVFDSNYFWLQFLLFSLEWDLAKLCGFSKFGLYWFPKSDNILCLSLFMCM